MAALNLAIIGKNSEPLFLKYFDNSHGISEDELFGVPSSSHDEKITTNCSLRHEFIVHAALDRLDQLAGPPPGVGWRSKPGLDGMFVGLLTPVEYMRVYGYVTTTKIKFLLVVEDDAVPEMQSSIDNDIKALLVRTFLMLCKFLWKRPRT